MTKQKETFFFFRRTQCHFCQNLSLSKHGVHCPGGNTTLRSKIKIECSEVVIHQMMIFVMIDCMHLVIDDCTLYLLIDDCT